MARRRKQAGSAMLEFVLVGIAMIFVLISLFEVGRTLWMYHTLAYALREGTRYAAMHGRDCAAPNTCQATIGTIATVILSAGPGLDPNAVTLTFTPQNGTATSGTITNLQTNTTIYPPTGSNVQGQIVKISGDYPLKTILAMFWVGAGAPVQDSQTFHLAASSTELIQF